VAHRENETITAGPSVILGVVAHYFLKEQISSWCQANSCAGVSVTDFFNGVCGYYLCRLYRQVIRLIPF
jgi:hypothetical protein